LSKARLSRSSRVSDRRNIRRHQGRFWPSDLDRCRGAADRHLAAWRGLWTCWIAGGVSLAEEVSAALSMWCQTCSATAGDTADGRPPPVRRAATEKASAPPGSYNGAVAAEARRHGMVCIPFGHCKAERNYETENSGHPASPNQVARLGSTP
jgi:hypothetical protein